MGCMVRCTWLNHDVTLSPMHPPMGSLNQGTHAACMLDSNLFIHLSNLVASCDIESSRIRHLQALEAAPTLLQVMH